MRVFLNEAVDCRSDASEIIQKRVEWTSCNTHLTRSTLPFRSSPCQTRAHAMLETSFTRPHVPEREYSDVSPLSSRRDIES